MRSEAADRVYGRHSGYRNLRVYQLAELLYDYTCRFCDRYVPPRDRQARDFEAGGGFSERLHKARSAQRSKRKDGREKTD